MKTENEIKELFVAHWDAKKVMEKIIFPKKAIVLMAMPDPIHSATAVMKMPRGNADRGVKSEDIITDCTDNEFVAVTGVEIAASQALLALYNAAIPSNRKARWRKLYAKLKKLMGYFQAAADLDPANAIEIIESGGFHVKEVTNPQNHVFAAFNSEISGRINLTAEGGGPNTAHDWWYSADRIIWVRIDPTINADTFMEGLPPGEFAYFNHQLITSDGPQGLEGVIEIRVL